MTIDPKYKGEARIKGCIYILSPKAEDGYLGVTIYRNYRKCTVRITTAFDI